MDRPESGTRKLCHLFPVLSASPALPLPVTPVSFVNDSSEINLTAPNFPRLNKELVLLRKSCLKGTSDADQGKLPGFGEQRWDGEEEQEMGQKPPGEVLVYSAVSSQ